MVEFALTFGILMLLAVASAQVEGPFQAALAGNGPGDGEAAAGELWARLEPGSPLSVTVSRHGRLVQVTATASAPALLPVPAPPFTRIELHGRATHAVETFQPGSGS